MGMHGQFNPDYGFGAYGNQQRPDRAWGKRRYKKQVYRRLRREARSDLQRTMKLIE